MCGIFGYVGVPIAVDEVVLGALRAMEYRGYDSWGTAFVAPDLVPGVIKGIGRVPDSARVHREASAAIGHTRWATHGAVSERNAHPHVSSDGRIAVVHNGIIENAGALKQRMTSQETWASDTDSELLAHLVAAELRSGWSLSEAVRRASLPIEGTNAFVVLDLHTQEIVAITRRLPICICHDREKVMVASDSTVFAGRAESIVVLPDDLPVSLGRPGIMAESLIELDRTGERFAVPEAAMHVRGGPGSSMQREIETQPAVLLRIADQTEEVRDAARLATGARRIVLTGCGSAFHAAWYAADRLAYRSDVIDAVAIPASEIQGRSNAIRSGDVVIALTQSGETADVVDAVAVAKERGARTVGFVNVPGSKVSRMVDVGVPLLAGTERSVLATKSFMAMLGRMVQLTDAMLCAAQLPPGGELDLHGEADALAADLESAPTAEWIHLLCQALVHQPDALVVGTGEHMALAAEAALKIKEGTYIHAEAIRAGELKHGVIALVRDAYPCLLISGAAEEATRQRVVAAELGSRGATVFEMVTDRGTHSMKTCGHTSLVSTSPFVQTAIGQRVALETALARSIDPDYPRNLAKSVTVR